MKMHWQTLAVPFRLLVEFAAFFRSRKSKFIRLLLLKIATKLSRFLAFLLPFKALIFLIADRKLHIHGHEIGSLTVASLIMLTATLAFATFFISNLYAKRLIESHFMPLRTENTQAAGSPRIALDLESRSTLESTAGFFATLILGTVLLVAIIWVMPLSSFTILGIAIYFYALGLLFQGNPGPGPVNLSNMNTVSNFVGILLVIVIIGLVATNNHSIPVIAALFVFIAWRQIMGSVSELAATLNRNRHGLAPRFLRKSFTDFDAKPFSIMQKVDPFLHRETQKPWFEEKLNQLLDTPTELIRLSWRDTTVSGVHSFITHARVGRARRVFFVVIYAQRAKALGQIDTALDAAVENLPFRLPFEGHVSSTRYNVAFFDFADHKIGNPKFFNQNLPDILKGLWSQPIDATFPLENHYGDMFNYINADAVDTLFAIAPNAAVRNNIEWFEQKFTTFKSSTMRLPRALFLPKLNPRSVVKHAEDGPKIAYWSEVDIQPLGSQIASIRNIEKIDLAEILAGVKEARDDATDVTVRDLIIAGSMYAIASALKRKNYATTFPLIDNMKSALELN